MVIFLFLLIFVFHVFQIHRNNPKTKVKQKLSQKTILSCNVYI